MIPLLIQNLIKSRLSPLWIYSKATLINITNTTHHQDRTSYESNSEILELTPNLQAP